MHLKNNAIEYLLKIINLGIWPNCLYEPHELIKHMTMDIQLAIITNDRIDIFRDFESLFTDGDVLDAMCFHGCFDMIKIVKKRIGLQQQKILCSCGHTDILKLFKLSKKHLISIAHCDNDDFVRNHVAKIKGNLDVSTTLSLFANDIRSCIKLKTKLCPLSSIKTKLFTHYHILKELYDLEGEDHELCHEFINDEWRDFQAKHCCLPYIAMLTNELHEVLSRNKGSRCEIYRLIVGRDYIKESLDANDLLLGCPLRAPDLDMVRRELKSLPETSLLTQMHLHRYFGTDIVIEKIPATRKIMDHIDILMPHVSEIPKDYEVIKDNPKLFNYDLVDIPWFTRAAIVREDIKSFRLIPGWNSSANLLLAYSLGCKKIIALFAK
jgi:hypothetical protein